MASPNVLLVAFHYTPEISAGVHRALILEEFLVRQGCRVTVATHQAIERGSHGADILSVPLPGCLKGATAKPAPQAPTTSSPTATPATPPQAISPLAAPRRWARRWLLVPDVFLGWSFRVAKAVSRRWGADPFDLVVTSSPPESVHWVGWRLKQKFGCRWLADFRDGWTLEPHRPEVALPGRRWVESRLEYGVVDRADWITVNAKPVADDFLQRHAAKAERIHVLPTGFADKNYEPLKRDEKLFRLVFTGRFSLSWPTAGPERFFRGLDRALREEREFADKFRLVLVGDLTDEERALWSKPPLDGVVEQLGVKPYEEAMRLATGATMLLLLTPPGLRSVIPRKFFDYLAARRPIFALSEENEVAAMLRETAAGISISPEEKPGKASDELFEQRVAEQLLKMFRLWKAGRLDAELPCTGNDLYKADRHFQRVLGDNVLAEMVGHKMVG